jgi:hypothetical protein
MDFSAVENVVIENWVSESILIRVGDECVRVKIPGGTDSG